MNEDDEKRMQMALRKTTRYQAAQLVVAWNKFIAEFCRATGIEKITTRIELILRKLFAEKQNKKNEQRFKSAPPNTTTI